MCANKWNFGRSLNSGHVREVAKEARPVKASSGVQTYAGWHLDYNYTYHSEVYSETKHHHVVAAGNCTLGCVQRQPQATSVHDAEARIAFMKTPVQDL